MVSPRMTVGSVGFNKDPTKEEKLFIIKEALQKGVNEDPITTPFSIEDVLNKKLLKNQNLSFQQRSAYKSKIKNEWAEFMADTNINFFDTNKLYVKSLADYKTRNYVKTKDD